MEGFIYFMGCGVSFIMLLIAFIDSSERMKKKVAFEYILLTALACCWLSWATPIWYIGNQLFTNKKSK